MANDQSSQMTGEKPLVSDVDGTLLRTDLLYETFWAALGRNLWMTLRVLLANWTNPAELKHKLRQIAEPDIELVPVRLSVLDRLLWVLDDGRSVYLVSGSDQILVENVAARFGLEGDHYGSENGCNLTGKTKGEFLTNKFGEGGYDYIGNGSADMPSWMGAQNVIAVTSRAALKKELSRLPNPVEIEEARFSPKALLRELRPLQWIKNSLLFFPLLAVHSTDVSSYLQVAVAAIGFSLGASSIYILNDLLDLSSDRSHPEKHNRPIASGDLSIASAMLASICIAIFALVLVWLVSPVGAVLTLTYMASSLGYSLWLKKFRWLDILALAGLFLLRVVTGVEVAQVETSGFLLVFVFGTFFTLACVKRMTALARLVKMDHLLVAVTRAATSKISLRLHMLELSSPFWLWFPMLFHQKRQVSTLTHIC